MYSQHFLEEGEVLRHLLPRFSKQFIQVAKYPPHLLSPLDTTHQVCRLRSTFHNLLVLSVEEVVEATEESASHPPNNKLIMLRHQPHPPLHHPPLLRTITLVMLLVNLQDGRGIAPHLSQFLLVLALMVGRTMEVVVEVLL